MIEKQNNIVCALSSSLTSFKPSYSNITNQQCIFIMKNSLTD
ncbi:hypothetical protein [Methanobrevibacter sp.]